jgi:hypothetical protein
MGGNLDLVNDSDTVLLLLDSLFTTANDYPYYSLGLL